jgi:hypothetical protein
MNSARPGLAVRTIAFEVLGESSPLTKQETAIYAHTEQSEKGRLKLKTHTRHSNLHRKQATQIQATDVPARKDGGETESLRVRSLGTYRSSMPSDCRNGA